MLLGRPGPPGPPGDSTVVAAVYKSLMVATSFAVPSSGAAADYWLSPQGIAEEGQDYGVVGGNAEGWLNLIASDYALAGKTAKLRLRASVATNTTAPAVTITFGLFPISSSAGGAGLGSLTLGAVVAGSTVAIATPGASSLVHGVSAADISLPADGPYILGLTLSGAVAVNSYTRFTTQLLMRHV